MSFGTAVTFLNIGRRSASTQNYEERTTRISVWYRYGKSRKAIEAYVEQYRRLDAFQVNKREFDGYGAGVGWSLF